QLAKLPVAQLEPIDTPPDRRAMKLVSLKRLRAGDGERDELAGVSITKIGHRVGQAEQFVSEFVIGVKAHGIDDFLRVQTAELAALAEPLAEVRENVPASRHELGDEEKVVDARILRGDFVFAFQAVNILDE